MPPEPTRLDELAATGPGTVVGDGAVTVTAVTHDSRLVGPGTLFVAIRGFTVDGHEYLDRAVQAGASAVCVETPRDRLSVPQLVVEDTRRSLGPMAAEVYGRPSEKMAVVGVTGTNGKTTVTYLIASISRVAGKITGLIGTVGARIGDRPVPLARTTPEASELQELLATMVDEGVELVAVEVSSHALELGRVDGTRFEVAAFTNLSQDHLDFHGDMERYYQAKAGLFTPQRAVEAVVFVDDPAGRRLTSEATIEVTTVGLESLDPAPVVRAEHVETALDRSRFVLTSPEGSWPVELPLAGRFNVANALIAGACALRLGVPGEVVAEGLQGVGTIPGRFEIVTAGPPYAVVVDYAHSPAGIESVVETARDLADGRVVAVVGAGGDRDREKRSAMGRAAAAADVVVITSDNPRSEDPATIADAVLEGTVGTRAEVHRELDRRAAIRWAVAAALPGDVVLILGKGHEQGQDLGDSTVPFDDREEARRAVAQHAAGSTEVAG